MAHVGLLSVVKAIETTMFHLTCDSRNMLS